MDLGRWIKLYEKAEESVAMSDPTAWFIWTKLMLRANWKVGFFKGVRIPRGSFAFGYRGLAEQWGLSHNTIRKWFDIFAQEGMIELESQDRRFTILRVKNYSKYQGGVSPRDTQPDTLTDTPNGPGVSPRDTQPDTLTDTDSRRDRKKEEELEENIAASAACGVRSKTSEPPPAETLTEFTFPCSGKGKGDRGKSTEWTLPQRKFDEYVDAYPALDIPDELRRARQWCRDNPQNRKTAGGMLSFLTRWFNKAQNRGGRVSDRKSDPVNPKYDATDLLENL